MRDLETDHIGEIKDRLAAAPLKTALPQTIGDRSVAGGLWRFFSASFPPFGGITAWNSATLWRGAWPWLSPDLFFFGEDVFGNQLTLTPGHENAFLWNHESGELVDLLLDPATLLETTIQSGIDWIDFYLPQMLAVAKAKLLDVPEGFHLHWTQPLILGGAVHVTNTSVLEGVSHLKSHGELWAQLRDLPPGTEVVVKPKK